MARHISKKAWAITLACAGMSAAQTFAQKEHHHDEKAENLKVLPKDIDGEQLEQVMHNYSKSLGVRCNYCHESHAVPGKERPEMNFASDKKPEKEIARDMMRMTEAINSQYIAKMGDHKLDPITCVTCHNGNIHPIISVDSLKRKM